MTRFILPLLAAVLLGTVAPGALAGSWNTNADGVVLDGHDVVAYRTLDKAVKGSARFSVTYDGVKFHFASAENKTMFEQDPARFAPRYNAYCAFAVGAKNAKVPANPDSFKLYNGKLLVFFNDEYEGRKFNTKIPWNENEQQLFQKAEANWQELAAE